MTLPSEFSAERGKTFDDHDLAWMHDWIEEGGLPLAYFAVVIWIDPDGRIKWREAILGDMPTTHIIGLAEAAKHKILSYPPDEEGA